MIRVALRHPGIDHAILCGKYGDRAIWKAEGGLRVPVQNRLAPTIRRADHRQGESAASGNRPIRPKSLRLNILPLAYCAPQIISRFCS